MKGDLNMPIKRKRSIQQDLRRLCIPVILSKTFILSPTSHSTYRVRQVILSQTLVLDSSTVFLLLLFLVIKRTTFLTQAISIPTLLYCICKVATFAVIYERVTIFRFQIYMNVNLKLLLSGHLDSLYTNFLVLIIII